MQWHVHVNQSPSLCLTGVSIVFSMSEFIAIVVYIHDKTAARRLSLVTSTSAVRPHCRRLWLRAAKAGSPACPPACSDRHIPYPSPHLTACRPRPPGRCPPSARPMTVGKVTPPLANQPLSITARDILAGDAKTVAGGHSGSNQRRHVRKTSKKIKQKKTMVRNCLESLNTSVETICTSDRPAWESLI